MVATPISKGQPVTVNPGEPAAQLQLPTIGLGIINVGTIAVNLSPLDPAQGDPFTLIPGGAISWPPGGTLYATVSGTMPGKLYVIPGIQSYASALAPAPAPIPTIYNGASLFIIPSGSSQNAILTEPLALWSWCWKPSIIASSPSKGTLLLRLLDFTIDSFLEDAIGFSEGGSNRPNGAIWHPGSGGVIQVDNYTDQLVDVFLTYSLI